VVVERPAEWRWSSARAHLSGHDDGLVAVAPLLAMVGDWQVLKPHKGGRPRKQKNQ